MSEILFEDKMFTIKDLDDYLIGKDKSEYVIKITKKQFHNLYGQLRGYAEISDMYDGFKLEVI